MKRFEVRSTRPLQIDGGGENNQVAGDALLATIQTNCDPVHLLSCLQFGNARLVALDAEREGEAPAEAPAEPTAEPTTEPDQTADTQTETQPEPEPKTKRRRR